MFIGYFKSSNLIKKTIYIYKGVIPISNQRIFSSRFFESRKWFFCNSQKVKPYKVGNRSPLRMPPQTYEFIFHFYNFFSRKTELFYFNDHYCCFNVIKNQIQQWKRILPMMQSFRKGLSQPANHSSQVFPLWSRWFPPMEYSDVRIRIN